jgi:nitroimidazol reductase NimA-like FMN-containing flavoprotein (pyridoxamine 5'-phosphate oxidase superfamily)
MLNKMKLIVQSNKVCALATVAEDGPHCSLMSYAVDEACRELYMMTSRNTKKYANLQKNSSVSLLIDTRAQGEDLSQVDALTVTGRFQQITDPARRHQVMKKLLEAHPHLEELASDPATAVFAVLIGSFQLLQGVTDAYYEKVE